MTRPGPGRPATVVVVMFFAIATFACSAPGSTAIVTSTDGAELFEARALGPNPGCVTCHSLTPGHVLVGPSLGDLASRHGDLGSDALRAYVRTSIVDPRAVGASSSSTRMPDTYAVLLSDEQIDALTDYVLEVSS